MKIRNIEAQHYPQLAEIYLQGIATGIATFQTESPDWADWDKNHLSRGRIGAFEGEIMAGWAALTAVSNRWVYAGVAEVSVYVGENFRGQGIGKLLLSQLITESENAGFWTLQSSIFAENAASIALHEKCGFRKIGYREKIGKKNNQWKDNIIMEKRSKIVGI